MALLMNGYTYKPLAVPVMKSAESIHVRPEDQGTRNHVKCDVEQISAAMMAALH